MIYLAVPKAILQNKGNLAMGSINFPVCSVPSGCTTRRPPAGLGQPLSPGRLGLKSSSKRAEGLHWLGERGEGPASLLKQDIFPQPLAKEREGPKEKGLPSGRGVLAPAVPS